MAPRFRNRTCPRCGSSDLEVQASGPGGAAEVVCLTCDHVFTSNQPGNQRRDDRRDRRDRRGERDY